MANYLPYNKLDQYGAKPLFDASKGLGTDIPVNQIRYQFPNGSIWRYDASQTGGVFSGGSPTAVLVQESGEAHPEAQSQSPLDFLQTHRDLGALKGSVYDAPGANILYDPTRGPTIDYGGGRSVSLPGQGKTYQPSTEWEKNILGNFAGQPVTPETIQAMANHLSDPNNHISIETRRLASDVNPAAYPRPSVPFPNLPPRPTPPDPNMRAGMETQYGVSGLSSQIESIDQQISKMIGNLRSRIGDIRGETVSSRVQGKEISMAQRGIHAQIQELRAQRMVLQRQLTEANHGISMAMSASAKSYADAEKEWSFEYNANQKQIAELNKEDNQEVQRAKSFLQTIKGYIQQGEPISEDLKNLIHTSEMIAFGPEFVGLTENLPVKPISQGTYTDSKTGTITHWSLAKDQNGVPQVTHTRVGQKSPAGIKANKANASAIMKSAIEKTIKSDEKRKDKYLSPDEWSFYKNSWLKNKKGTKEDFKAKFWKYQNPNDIYN